MVRGLGDQPETRIVYSVEKPGKKREVRKRW